MRRRRMHFVLLLLCGPVVLAGCIKSTDDWAGKGGPPRVLVSFPPLYSFVKSVGGDHVGVISLCSETGPHHYEGDARDHRLLARADLFFTNGLGLDDKFAGPLAAGKAGKDPFLIKLGDHLPAALVDKFDDEDKNDPHVWLGIPQAQQMTDHIRDELKRVDAAHAADYDANALKYRATLDKLQKYGEDALKDKKDRKIISFHDSLHYFARSYGLNIVAVIEIEPGVTPTQVELAKLVELIRKEGVHVIAVEPQYPNSNAANTLLAELKGKGFTDITLVEIDPLETADAKELSADLYERKVRENLDNLAKHLQ